MQLRGGTGDPSQKKRYFPRTGRGETVSQAGAGQWSLPLKENKGSVCGLPGASGWEASKLL